MTADPRDSISEFTEMTDEEMSQLIGSLFRAIGWGAFAGGGFFLILTIPAAMLGIVNTGKPAALLFAIFPLAVALAGTAIGMIVIGLPLTALLRHFRREQAPTYARVGMVAGGLLPFTILSLAKGTDSAALALSLFFGLFGTIAGGVTGNIWGEFRESRYAFDTPPEDDEPYAPTNPFHDMIY